MLFTDPKKETELTSLLCNVWQIFGSIYFSHFVVFVTISIVFRYLIWLLNPKLLNLSHRNYKSWWTFVCVPHKLNKITFWEFFKASLMSLILVFLDMWWSSMLTEASLTARAQCLHCLRCCIFWCVSHYFLSSLSLHFSII